MPTNIEYLDETWNITTGCEPISPGCVNCWAKAMTERFGDAWGYDFTPQFHKDRLEIPLKWKRPRRIGVSFMGDLFHNDVTYEQQYDIFWEMAYTCKYHTFIILTKRPENMREFYKKRFGLFPPENIWLGVSAENQEQADKRIPILLDIPAAVRFVSVEPMLGPVDLVGFFEQSKCSCGWIGKDDDLVLSAYSRWCPRCGQQVNEAIENKISWVIIGSESGPGARRVDNSHILNLLLQCSDANVPVFLKQAWMNGKLVKMPEIGGRAWDQMPGEV